MLLKPSMIIEDSNRWGFTTNGVYSTRSGYKLLETLIDFDHPHSHSLSPIERQLWKDLWKIKAPPKIKHFMWRALSGALAVKQRLTTRGIPIDATCSVCGIGAESICHVLFTCTKASATWEQSNFPLPSGGFSRNSTFLNFFHLIKVAKSSTTDSHTRAVFPWLLWEIWKARNAFTFENKIVESSFIAKRAYEEESTWCNTFSATRDDRGEDVAIDMVGWKKPPPGLLKCNVASSWVNSNHISGALWILRDENESTIMHSRRAYSCMRTKTETDLWALYWAVECLQTLHFSNIIFETSSEDLRDLFTTPGHHILSHIRHQISLLLANMVYWSLDHALPERNDAAVAIALSVTRDLRHQSYIARHAPVWLHHLIALEAK